MDAVDGMDALDTVDQVDTMDRVDLVDGTEVAQTQLESTVSIPAGSLNACTLTIQEPCNAFG